MEKINLTVDEENIRADKYISEKTEYTRSHIAKLFAKECVSANNKSIKPSSKLKLGDRIEIEVPPLKEILAKPQNIAIEIVYEDDSLLIINKPRDMVVHPAPGSEENTLVNALMYHCKGSLSGINGEIRPGIVHRIDKDTTGLLIVAKNDEAHMKLSEQLKDRTLSRKYFALVNGNIKEDGGQINAPIGRSEADRKKMCVTNKNSREAVTDFEVLERFSKYTLVKCSLKTGRTHQIRVHMKYIGHPIVGDKTYGVKKEEFNLKGQLLHAGEITFVHPASGKKMTFTVPLAEDFEKVLRILRTKNQ